mmetsp:Transcript_25913/g.39742  ORF Transcript_25913/g.39742 Transcript_25913/m.39742 type:complete len:95 (-) Transcript_25913:382-666(-)|eukprot:CAMPEP_0170511160 /NCGR_PEP_ID=MMETSP0208-20121228/66150_1 /TAXON_ID=197538 /ORGANISM="Strombidium inclinatum, Strain S3" /LENGTH=94 /DNA_ID=CAMNT_0010794669 /DNA_START=1708 /DNA_END=1992 /DNA_ORIENTATION=-
MPISDGYDACSKILNIFSEDFIHISSNALDPQGSQEHPMIASVRAGKSGKKSPTGNHHFVQKQELKPVIIALSSFINDDIEAKTKEVGFRAAIT